ncbi:MAG: Hsp33 family molecular chaperone [Aquisalinus sp.]|nr:Hsp33 family molecular chaperone [Aquisalinus sp.]
MSDTIPTLSDNFILPFQVGNTSVRGKTVRLGSVVDEILTRHGFPDPLSMLLGEASALVSMLGASLKFDGKLIFQAQGDGPVSMIVADYTAGGNLRATASFKQEKLDIIQKARGPELHYLLAKGHMVMTIDQGPDMERYQGVTPLEGPTLEVATVNYFKQSEQIPTAIKLAVGRLSAPGEVSQWRAGGIMVQFMPGEGGSRERGEAELMREDDEETWNNAAALLHTASPDELLDPMLGAQDLLYRLYHENGVRAFDPLPVNFGCTCNRGKVQRVLDQFTDEEREEMTEDGQIRVECEFCRTPYVFDA